MKHVEKLDLVLRELYKYRFNGKKYSIKEIINNIGLDAMPREPIIIGKRLEEEGLIEFTPTKESAYAKINSFGIEYCESTSHTDISISISSFNFDYLKASTDPINSINQLRKLVQNSKLDEAIYSLHNLENDKINVELLDALLGRLTRIKTDDIKGIISLDEKNIGINKISSLILDLIKLL